MNAGSGKAADFWHPRQRKKFTRRWACSLSPRTAGRQGRDRRAEKGNIPELVADHDIRGILHAHTDALTGSIRWPQWRKRRASEDTSISASRITRSRPTMPAGCRSRRSTSSIARSTPKRRVRQAVSYLQGHRIRHPCRRLARLSGRRAGAFRLRRCQHPRPLPAEPQGADRADHQGRVNPYTTILGHMTGRQLLRRPGYEVDIEKILKACAKHGVAVEINANPWRLDLDWRWHGGRLNWLHDEHQPRCSLDQRDRPDPMGGRDGSQGRRAGRPRAELSVSRSHREAVPKPKTTL